ncbi:MAG: type II toxin-antitoxin system RelE/ParE family toxin [Cyclobacteriaceae bacterium]|nr:type II toxin-antitoxin system RelE/ParE family toxin [Cyclobacteriaceae bacterium]
MVSFIQKKWGLRTAKQFVRKSDEIFKLLKNYPRIGQIENGDIRGFQLSPQTRLLYRIRDQKIIILSFFDVRKDPQKKLG